MLVYSYSNKNEQGIPLRKNSVKNKTSFKGLRTNILNAAEKMSKNAAAPMYISTLGMMFIRPPIIYSDKKTPKSDKIFTASWLFALSATALGVFKMTEGTINKLSDKIALKTFGIKPKNFLSPEKIKKSKNIFESLYKEQTNAKNLQKVTHAYGFSKLLGFIGLGVIVSQLNTVIVTRYLEKGMNKISKKLWGKTATGKPEKTETPEEKAKRQKTDKFILGGLLTAGALAGLHKITKRGNNSSLVTDAAIYTYKKLDQVLPISQGFKSLADKISNSCKNNPNGMLGKSLRSFAPNIEEGLINPKAVDSIKTHLGTKSLKGAIDKANAKKFDWTYAGMISNMVMRPGILLAAKQHYSAANSFCNEGLSLVSSKVITPLVDKTKPAMQKLWKAKTNKEIAGADFITNQLIKNVGIICIAMGFANNYVSRWMLNGYKALKNKTPKQEKSEKIQTA